MERPPVHIAPFSNEYAMNTISIHITPANGVVNPPFKTKPFVSSCQKVPIATLNAIQSTIFMPLPKMCFILAPLSLSKSNFGNSSHTSTTPSRARS